MVKMMVTLAAVFALSAPLASYAGMDMDHGHGHGAR